MFVVVCVICDTTIVVFFLFLSHFSQTQCNSGTSNQMLKRKKLKPQLELRRQIGFSVGRLGRRATKLCCVYARKA